MIHPVRPVGVSTSGVQYALPAVCDLLHRPTRRGCGRILLWVHVPLGVSLHRRLVELRAADGLQVSPSREAAGALFIRGEESGAGQVCAWAPIEPWAPWTAHPPFVDEVTRWWPFEEFPPDEPPPVIEDPVADMPAPIVEYAGGGGLIDYMA